MSAIAAAPSDDRTRPGAILVGCLVGFLVGEIVATVLVAVAIQVAHYPGGLHALGQSKAPPWWSNVASLAGLWSGFAGAIFFATTAGRLTALPRQWRIKPSDSLYVLLGAACQAVVALAYAPFHFKSLSQPVHHLFGGARGVTFALLALMTTLVSPFIEEWFFRGVLYRALHEGLTRAARRWGAAGAVLLSAALFALAHGEPLQFAGLAFLGVVLAVLVRRTQRLVPSVITHVSFNGVAMIALLMQRSGALMRGRLRDFWTPLRVLEAAGVIIVIYVTMWSLHPNLLLSSSTITGGDTGSHLALPAYLRTQGNLFNLTPWYPGWFAGMPAYTYYFVLPDVLATWASYLINFTVAFKLATVLGSVLMPIAAYGMGRLFRAARPVPLALALATLPFLFDSSYTIDGGNLFSTMAGEYAFSLSLAFALITIGLFARGVTTGRGYWVSALALSATLAAHVLPWFFAVGAAGVLVVFELLQRRGIGDPREVRIRGDFARPLRFAFGAGLLSAGLSAWWLTSFVTTQNVTNSMGYSNDNVSSLHSIFTILGWYNTTGGAAGDRWVIVTAAVACVVAFGVRDRLGMVLATLTALSLAAFVLDPQGVIWNERLVPYWYITIHLSAGWLFGYGLARWAHRTARRRTDQRGDGPAPHDAEADQTSYLGADALVDESADVELVDVELTDVELTDDVASREHEAKTARRTVRVTVAIIVLGVLTTVPGLMPPVASALGLSTSGNQVSSWAQWNYSGYENKPAWPEYHDLIATMQRASHRYGCGRAMWEYNSSENRFGTPMALMLLPYWTNNCVDSMEGLFFESSATTPYHFLDQAELSAAPSNPQVGLAYGPLNIVQGVRHLQMLGVKYYIAFSPSVITLANSDPELQFIASTRAWPSPGVRWRIYRIKDSPIVQALRTLPNVVSGLTSRTNWLDANTSWWLHPTLWGVLGASSGPSSWPHVRSIDTMKSVTVPDTTITDVKVGTQSISFHVSRVGRPVLVKISYFSRWHATGAAGPYRVSPNLMVVVPTSNNVSMVYGSSPALLMGNIVSDLCVIAGLVVLWLRLRKRRIWRK